MPCSHSATARSAQAATQPVGISLATSSAWEGPESAAMGCPGSVSASISDIRRPLSGSTPLATVTSTASGIRYGLTRRAVCRMA